MSLAVALASGAAWLLIVASNMSGVPLTSVFQGGVIGIVLTQTHFGIDWIVRAGLIAVLATVLAVQPRTHGAAPRWIGLIASASFMGSLAWAGHAGAAEDVPFDWIHAPADVLHLLATGAWLGALLPLAMFLAQALRDQSAEAVAIARRATVRFSVIGLTCVATLIVTGTANTWFLAGSIPALLGTLYGQLLLIKIALFAAIIALAGVNQRKLVPCLADAASEAADCVQAIRRVCRNASMEAFAGIFVLTIVGMMGILPPGLHTEPHWPLPFRFSLSEGFVRAYPTSFYASTQPYSAPSVARGAPLYASNCVVCHGADGRGDGPLASKLPVRPADLTEEHLFAHKPGEIFWWISNGSDNRVMPGFADKLTADQRWDLINFILARAAGDLAKNTSSRIGTATALPLPDFAFERNGTQNTLDETLKTGPVLVVLFPSRAPRARLDRLAQLQPRLAAAGLHVVAVGLRPAAGNDPLIVDVSQDVRTALELFRSPSDGGETELMLDRGANVRARWTANEAGGLADAAVLLSDAARVASIPVAAPNHAGHGQ